MKPIKLDWIKHISDPQRREDFEKTLRNSTLIFTRQNEILDEWERVLLNEETKKDQYSFGSWQCLQAHRNGNREIIQKLRDLISFV